MLCKDGKIFLKILYWGPAAGGKTTCLQTLHRMAQDLHIGIKPLNDLKEYAMASGATLYFDRGVYESTTDSRIRYYTYTVAGQPTFAALRKKVLQGTDGVIVVIDAHSRRWDDCVNSMKELRNLLGSDLLTIIPICFLLNKKDLPSIISIDQVKQLLKDLHLWFDEPADLVTLNPRIYESIALYELRKNVYESFLECARLAEASHLHTEQFQFMPAH